MSTKGSNTTPSPDSIIVSVRMRPNEADDLRVVAKSEERSMSFIARRAINDHVREQLARVDERKAA